MPFKRRYFMHFFPYVKAYEYFLMIFLISSAFF